VATLYVVCWALLGQPWQCSIPLDDLHTALVIFEANAGIGKRVTLRNVSDKQDAVRFASAMMERRAE
jgi:hypothetical protein